MICHGSSLHLVLSMKPNARILEKTIAAASFVVAVVLSFVSLLISDDYDIASNVLFVVAQFLTLTATLLGIDYKFSASTPHGNFESSKGPALSQ